MFDQLVGPICGPFFSGMVEGGSGSKRPRSASSRRCLAVTRFLIVAPPFVTSLVGAALPLRNAIIVFGLRDRRRWTERVVGTQHRALLVFVAFAATCCLWTPMAPLTDAYALRGVSHYGLNYGPLRLWGSAAFVVGALACGLLVDVIAPEHLIWVIAAVAGLSALASLGLQPIDGLKRPTSPPRGSGRCCATPGFLAIIVAAALIQGSHAAYYTFASIVWKQSGLGGLTIAGLRSLRAGRDRAVCTVAAVYAAIRHACRHWRVQRRGALDHHRTGSGQWRSSLFAPGAFARPSGLTQVSHHGPLGPSRARIT